MSPAARRVVLYGFCAAVFAVGLLFGAARVTATSAARSLELAWAELSSASAQETSPEQGLSALRQARARVAGSDATLNRLDVRMVAALPLVGRSLDAERDVVTAAREALDAALVAAEHLPSLDAQGGGVDVAALREFRVQLDGPLRRAEAAHTALQSTSTALTPAVVARGVVQARDALEPALSALRTAHEAVGLAESLLGSSAPRPVLVALENNAELRGTGGYVASFATGRIEEGKLRLDPLRDVAAVADDPALARRVPAPPEFRQDYGHLSGDTTIWRSWNMSPDVPQSAQVGAEVAGVLLGEKPEIMILLDVPGMSALAALGGAAVALPDGTRVSPDELEQALLVDAYAEAGVDADAQGRRRKDLQAAATTAVSQLLTSDLPVLETVRTLEQLADERHLKIWSARAEEQRVLETLGVAGALAAPPDSDLVHVSVNNVGANKLDVYVDREVSLDVVVAKDRAEVVQRVTFANRAPDDLVPYVAGQADPGTVTSLVELSAPLGAQELTATLDGNPWPGSHRAGDERQRLATRVQIARGGSAEVELRYSLPLPEEGAYRVRVEPQPLVNDAQLRLSVRAADGEALASAVGAAMASGRVEQVSTLAGRRDVEVMLFRPEPPLLERWSRAFRDFWNSPVSW